MIATLKQYAINKNFIEIKPADNGSAKLSVEVNTKINPPKSKEDNKTAHFKLDVNIRSIENEMIAISLEMNCLFEFDAPPKEYNDKVSQECASVALPELSAVLDGTLQLMKYPPIELWKNLEPQNQ